jgi:hypothetical protein
MDFFDKYGNISSAKYEKIGNFLLNIDKWNLQRNKEQYYDEELYSVTNFIENIVYSISKIYPNILMYNEGFYNKIPKHWGLSDFHNNDVSKFINKYYQDIEKFKNDNVLLELLKHVVICLNDVNLFVKNIPICTEIIKKSEEKEEENKDVVFYSLFDKQTTYMLFTYCLYSCLYEYVMSSDDNELLSTDVQQIKETRRKDIREYNDEASQIITNITEENDLINENDNELQELQIVVGNKDELKKRVCSMLLSFLDIEVDNKNLINLSYKQLMEKVGRSKEKEKKNIIRNLGNMDIEERRVENMLKNFRIGRWNVGQQKGLVQYDKDTYNRERNEIIMDALEEIESGRPDVVTEMMRDIYEIENTEEQQADEEEMRDVYGLQALGNDDGFMDGIYYEEDREDEDFPDD